MRVSVDLDLCQGHQMCLTEAPEVFGFDRDTDRAVVLVMEPPGSLHDAVRRAARYCPALAIEIAE